MTKLEKHVLFDKRVITIFIPKEGRTIDFEVGPAFVPTEEWVDEILEDPQLAECKEFLNQKRFLRGKDGRWHKGMRKADVAIRLPDFFLDRENRKLKVKFGAVTCREFGIPELYNGYASLDEFPTEILNINGKRGHLTLSKERDEYDNIGIDTSLVFNAYNNFYGELLEDSRKEKNVNSQYYTLILKFHVMMTMKKDDTHGSTQVLGANKEFFEKDADYLRIEERETRLLRSKEGIEKFNL